MSDARANSVKQLADLYNVVIGIALSAAIYNTIDQSTTGVPLHFDHLFNFGTVLVTIIPFYHGAVRHLMATYVEDGGSSQIKSGALMADYILLFLEGCVFVTLAVLIANTETLVWVIVSLLLLDSIWGFLAWLAFTGARSQYAERKWAIINLFCTGVLVLIGVYGNSTITSDPLMAQGSIFCVMVIRTIVDYGLCWNFYYPSIDRG